MEKQLTSSVLMIRPVSFGFNPETAASNAFQKNVDTNNTDLQTAALLEFERFSSSLRDAGINVYDFTDTPYPHTPDSVFPNNWVSFHEDGRVILYPMEAHNRRLERKEEIIIKLRDEHGFEITEIIDLSFYENENKFLEGTGSMMIDREHKLVYACRSSRTHPEVLEKFCSLFGYTSHLFDAVSKGLPVYHTNVMMALGQNISIICAETIHNKSERDTVLGLLRDTGKTIVEITEAQMSSFAGNMLQLQNPHGKKILVMSEQGYKSLRDDQKDTIKAATEILFSDISHIEMYGGGSTRCMLAEIFCKKKK